MEKTISQQMETLFREFLSICSFKAGQIIVIGCSTSEVNGDHIGKAGSMDIATALFEPLCSVAAQYGVRLAFQCCEHLNRALVVERATMEAYALEEVAVIPFPHAGGSMASCAYRQMDDAVVVETIRAHGGIDIGETMIGMHLKPVAVPCRLSSHTIGEARVNAAYTRAKLIGGERAHYVLESDSCGETNPL